MSLKVTNGVKAQLGILPMEGPLSEEEAYLVAIMTDRSGIDAAEFLMVDEE